MPVANITTAQTTLPPFKTPTPNSPSKTSTMVFTSSTPSFTASFEALTPVSSRTPPRSPPYDKDRRQKTSAATVARLAKTPDRTAFEPAQIDWKAVTDAVYDGTIREHLEGLVQKHVGLSIADIDRGPKPDAVSFGIGAPEAD